MENLVAFKFEIPRNLAYYKDQFESFDKESGYDKYITLRVSPMFVEST